MRVSSLQQDIVWENLTENLRKVDAAIDSDPGADLYVLTEMFPTGFCTEPSAVAEPDGGRAL